MAPFSISKRAVATAIIPLLLAASWPVAKATTNPVKTLKARSHATSYHSRLAHHLASSSGDEYRFGRSRRNLQTTGEPPMEQQTEQTGNTTVYVTDNIFLHNNNTEECACGLRRGRNLGVGHSSSCSCDEQTYVSGKGYNSKGSKSYSSSSGKGGSSKSEKSSKSNHGKGAVSPSKGSKKSKSSKKSSKSYRGKGYGGTDDDYVYPTSKPTSNPFGPSPTPAPNAQPTNPTPAPIPQPSSPTPAPIPQPTPAPNNNNNNGGGNNDNNGKNPPKPPPELAQCSVDQNGMYGDKVGISTEFRFLYTAQVIPGITETELNIDMLPKAEIQQGNDLLPKLFPNECSSQGSVAKRSVAGNQRRRLQLSSLNGMSIKPRDTALEGETCQGVDSTIFPCFVVEGYITVFSSANLNSIETFQIENMISSTFPQLANKADNRFLGLSFQEFLEERPPQSERWYERWYEWLLAAEWWILALIALGVVIVLILLLVCCVRCCRRRKQRKADAQQQQPVPVASWHQQQQQQTSVPPDVEQVLPMGDDDSSSSSNSSIASNDKNDMHGRGPAPSSSNNGYQYHSDTDQINEALMPNRNEPIMEERQEDLSSGRYDSEPIVTDTSQSLYMQMPPDDEYNGVSYEDRIYQNNSDDMDFNPQRFDSTDEGSENGRQDDYEPPSNYETGTSSQYETGVGESSDDYSRSRSLRRDNQEFRNLDGRDINSQGSPRHKLNSNTSPSMYSSDIQSNTSRQMSYRDEEVVNGESDEDSFEDVEEEYEIVYTSQSEKLGNDQNEGFYEEFVDENDPATSNSASNSNTNSAMNSQGRSNSHHASYGIGEGSHSGSSYSKSVDSNNEDTNLAYLAHTAQMQQQNQGPVATSSFDSLRKKWET